MAHINKTLRPALLLAAIAIMSTSQAHAIDLGVSSEIGTTGAGVHVSVPITPTLNARFGANYFNYSFYSRIYRIGCEASAKLRTYDALLDWFPFENGFRLTAGAIYNRNTVDIDGKPDENNNYRLNGTDYSADLVGKIHGNVAFKKYAPYLGIGYGNAATPGKGWGFTADAGVMFQGRASTSINSTNCALGTAGCAQLASDIATENGKLNDKLRGYRMYPVVRVGVSYTF